MLERLRIPRALGAGAVVALLLVLGFGVSASVAPMSAWFDQAPRVLRQLERKIYPIKKTVREMSKATDQVDRIASVDREKAVAIQSVSYKDVLYDNAGGLLTGASVAILLLYFSLPWGGMVIRRIGELMPDGGRRGEFIALTKVLEGEVSKHLATLTAINAASAWSSPARAMDSAYRTRWCGAAQRPCSTSSPTWAPS